MKIVIAFATLSGNTELVANELQRFLVSKSYKVDLLNLDGASANDLKKYELVFLGSSTYGNGELNLIMDIFLSNAESTNHDCHHTKFAIFSLGDSIYPNFATADVIVKEKVSSLGGVIIFPSIKIDGYPDDNVFERVKQWSLIIIRKINN